MGERKVQVGFMRHFPELRGQFGIIGQAENKKNTFKWLMLKMNCETIRKDWYYQTDFVGYQFSALVNTTDTVDP